MGIALAGLWGYRLDERLALLKLLLLAIMLFAATLPSIASHHSKKYRAGQPFHAYFLPNQPLNIAYQPLTLEPWRFQHFRHMESLAEQYRLGVPVAEQLHFAFLWFDMGKAGRNLLETISQTSHPQQYYVKLHSEKYKLFANWGEYLQTHAQQTLQ
jgi:hypothetical protein